MQTTLSGFDREIILSSIAREIHAYDKAIEKLTAMMNDGNTMAARPRYEAVVRRKCALELIGIIENGDAIVVTKEIA